MEGHGIQTAVIGFPRIGPDRELKQALEAFWARPSRRPTSCERRPRPRSGGNARCRRRCRRGRAARATTSRSTTTCSTPRCWSAPCPERFARLGGRPLDALLRAWPAARGDVRAAGDDQVVRHQLPLPRPRARARARASRSRRPSRWSRAAPRRWRSASRTRPGAARPGHASCCWPRAPARAGSSRSTCSTCCRSTRSCWRRCAAAGVARVQLDEPLPGRRPAGERRSSRSSALRRGWPRLRRASSSRWRPTSAGSADALRAGPAAARSTSCTSTWCARPEQLERRAGGGRRRARGCRSASSTAATSGAPTSTRALDRVDRPLDAARRRAGRDRAVLLAAARPLRRRARARPRPRAARAGWRSPPRSSQELRRC